MRLIIDEKTGTFTLTGELDKSPKVTEKGNTVIASSHGNQPIAVNGKVVKVGLNIYIPA